MIKCYFHHNYYSTVLFLLLTMDVLYYHSNNKIRLNLREIEDLDLKPRLYQVFEKLMIINWMEICWGNFPYGMREVNKSWARSLLTWSCPSNWTEKPFLEVNSECLGLILCGTILKKNPPPVCANLCFSAVLRRRSLWAEDWGAWRTGR